MTTYPSPTLQSVTLETPLAVSCGGSGATVPSATSQSTVSAPTAPASTSAYTMQGLAGAITPTRTGRVLFSVWGTIVSPAGTAAGNGINCRLAYGTGVAPANGSAITGTQVGAVQTYTNPTTVTAADVAQPFFLQVPVTGLTLNAAYWFDVAAESVGTASDMGLKNINVSAVEL